MNDFREMELMYEAIMRRPQTRSTHMSYPPGESDNMNHSLRVRPLTDPGGSGRIPDGALASSNNNAGVCDEEDNADMSTFMRQDILKKIESLMKNAESFDDTKTLIALSELKTFVEKL